MACTACFIAAAYRRRKKKEEDEATAEQGAKSVGAGMVIVELSEGDVSTPSVSIVLAE